jgi:hypothetical protein
LAAALLLELQQLVELVLVQGSELFFEAATVVNPQPDGLFQGARDVQQSALTLVPRSQIQGAVRLAFLAAAGGLATRAGAFEQTAAQEGLLGDQLGQLGTCVAFSGRAVRAMLHGVSSFGLT